MGTLEWINYGERQLIYLSHSGQHLDYFWYPVPKLIGERFAVCFLKDKYDHLVQPVLSLWVATPFGGGSDPLPGVT